MDPQIPLRDPRTGDTFAAMSSGAASMNRGRAFIGALLFGAFLWAIALTVSPRLHARVHADANGADHTCAVTLVASGSYEYAAHSSLVSGTSALIEFSNVATLNPLWVPSPFLWASILEHAPPVSA